MIQIPTNPVELTDENGPQVGVVSLGVAEREWAYQEPVVGVACQV